MKLDDLKLYNFRRLKALGIRFHPELTVLVAKNGQGKTTVLDAATIVLSTFVGSFDLDFLRREIQDDGERVRFWASVPELKGRYLRVITLKDEQTIHNAFPDRRFKMLLSYQKAS